MLSPLLGQKRQRGLESLCPLTRPRSSVAKLKLQEPQLPSSAARGLLDREFLEGGKKHLKKFFFYFSLLLTRSARCHGV